ncbi:MAG: zinc-ribbon domain-containing protein [bacterium]
MRIQCPHCEELYEVPDELAGMSINCKLCGRVFNCQKIPDDSPLLPSKKSKLPAGFHFQKKKGNRKQFINCPKCNKFVKIIEDAVDKTIICTHCGYSGIADGKSILIENCDEDDSKDEIYLEKMIGFIRISGWVLVAICIISSIFLFHNSEYGALGIVAVIAGLVIIVFVDDLCNELILFAVICHSIFRK